MKKIFFFFVALCCCFGNIMAKIVESEYLYDELYYTIEEDENGAWTATVIRKPRKGNNEWYRFNSVKTVPREIPYNGKTVPVEAIGEWAFTCPTDWDIRWGPEVVIKVALQEGIKTIGKRAFWCNKDVAFETLPSTVQTIEEYAFWGSHVRKILIPAATTFMGDNVFGSKLEEIRVEEGNPRYGILNDALYDLETMTLREFPSGMKRDEIYIHPDTKHISPSLEGIKAELIVFPSSIEKLEHWELRQSIVTTAVIHSRTIGSDFGCEGVIHNMIIGEEIDSVYSQTYSTPKNIYVFSETPPKTNNLIAGHVVHHYAGGVFLYDRLILENSTLYVPKGCIDAYKADFNWSLFAEYKEIDQSLEELVDYLHNNYNNVKEVEQAAPVQKRYDLSGRPVDSSKAHGIIIENGRKVKR